jgi:UDP-N-acetylmuramoyl-L-alanyl-D-glutamate--2,6-diaminopimelate ligase
LTVIIDYAHTPDALQNVLDTINDIRRDEQLITVVGCGGNRDATKRPVMARIAADNSDKTIFTSDNPRFEEPEAILTDMKAGLDAAQRNKSLFITNRHEAIRTALMLAQPGHAIVLIAGKGHETYQEIQGERIHFDDKETAQELLQELGISKKNRSFGKKECNNDTKADSFGKKEYNNDAKADSFRKKECNIGVKDDAFIRITNR